MRIFICFLFLSSLIHAQQDVLSVKSYYIEDLKLFLLEFKNTSENKTIIINGRSIRRYSGSKYIYAELGLYEPYTVKLIKPSKWGVINFNRIEPGERFSFSLYGDLMNYSDSSIYLYLDFILISFTDKKLFNKGIKDKRMLKYAKRNKLVIHNRSGYIRFKDEMNSSCVIEGETNELR